MSGDSLMNNEAAWFTLAEPEAAREGGRASDRKIGKVA